MNERQEIKRKRYYYAEYFFYEKTLKIVPIKRTEVSIL
jgi:hypothetical protein